MPLTAILVASVLYGAASFAASQVAILDGARATPPVAGRFQQELVRMIVVLFSTATGAMLESRHVSEIDGSITPADVLMGGFVLAGLSAAIVGGFNPAGKLSDTLYYVELAPIVVVILVSFVESQWFSLGAGVLCALPFAISASFYPRLSATEDAMYAALAGASMSLFPAMAVLFLASLATIAYARVRKVTTANVRFAPFVAGFAMAGLLVQVTLTT